MLLSALCLSLSLGFVKIGSSNYPFFWIVFVRYLLGLLCLVAIFLFKSKLLELVKTSHLRFHIFRVLAIAAAQYCLFYYLTKSTLFNATVLVSTAPFFIPLIERVFLGHSIAKSTWVSLFVGGVGLVLILHPGKGFFQWVDLYGLAAGFLSAVSQTIYGLTIRRENMQGSIFYIFFLGTLLSIPALFIFPISFAELPKQALHFQGLVVVLLLAITSLLNQYFRGKAYRLKKPTTLATFVYASIVISGVFDWAFFHIVPSLLTIIGSVLIIVGGGLKVYLRHLFLKRKA